MQTEDFPIFIRLRQRFRHRASEWFCAANTLWWGLSLVHPDDTFASSIAYTAFRNTLNESALGAALTVLGAAWIAGLIVNGKMQRVTSTTRAICALVGAVSFGMLAFGFIASIVVSGTMNTASGNYTLVSILAFYSLYWIAIDKRNNG